MARNRVWWLISDDDTRIIQEALAAPGGDESRKNALHVLDTGLHVSDSIPADLIEEEWLDCDEIEDCGLRRSEIIKALKAHG